MNKLVIITKNPQTYFIERLIKDVGEDKVKLFNPWTDLEFPMGENYLVRTTGVYGSDFPSRR